MYEQSLSPSPVAHAPGSPTNIVARRFAYRLSLRYRSGTALKPHRCGVHLMPATPLTQVAVHLRPEDNVAVAARPLLAGQEFSFDGAVVVPDRRVGLGHKIAVRPIAKGEAVRKYG